jgi:hypothetical protein
VVDARGIELAPGAKIDGAKVLVLAAGQRLTLISADGRSLKLRGPYEDAPAPAQAAATGANVGDALKNLMNQRVAGTAALGVVRAGGAAVDLPDPWVLDVSRSGARCLVGDATPVLWGPRFAQATDIGIEPADRSWRARGQWSAETDRFALLRVRRRRQCRQCRDPPHARKFRRSAAAGGMDDRKRLQRPSPRAGPRRGAVSVPGRA